MKSKDVSVHSPEELVSVMVPRRLLSAVYGFIATNEASAQSTETGALHRGWTAPMILEAYNAASERMRTLLDLLASRPGEKLTIQDFEKALGAEEEKENFINGVLGAFGRLTNQRFAARLPDRANTSPFTVSKDIRNNQWYYEMPESVADVIKSIDG